MLSVALTGNVASGKSTVARLWADEGVPIVSADELARAVVEPGTEGLREVIHSFGKDVLAPDGRLDRGRLGEEVFRDPDARERLETILHPRIRTLREAWLLGQREKGEELVVAEIPLLFETGYHDEFDVTVVVHASEEVRLDRLERLRGLDGDAAWRIMGSQMDPGEKLELADYVVENDGSRDQLREGAMELLAHLGARARRHEQ